MDLSHAIDLGRASGHVFAHAERFLEAFFEKASADACDSGRAATEGARDLLVRTGWAGTRSFIGEQEDASMLDRASVASAGARKFIEVLALVLGEADAVLGGHGESGFERKRKRHLRYVNRLSMST